MQSRCELTFHTNVVSTFARVEFTLLRASESQDREDATAAVLEAFKTHDIVMLGEIHNNKQEYEWLDALVANSEFADQVDDVVVELGNSLYQKSVDRYIAGEAVPDRRCATRLAQHTRFGSSATNLRGLIQSGA